MEVKIMLKIKDVEIKLTDEELGELYSTIKRLMGRTEYIPYPLYPQILPYEPYVDRPYITVTC